MDASGTSVKKVEDSSGDPTKPPPKQDVKPVVKTLNRVPRTHSTPSPLAILLIDIPRSIRGLRNAFSLQPSPLLISLSIQNACRKQKMRCEGADNPPCRRCRHAGLDCLFEKPSREATLTGEAGLE